MKQIMRCALIGILATILFSACASTNHVYQSNETIPPDITYQTFYDNLSPYGNWIDYPGYGHVWNPRMEPGFRPYATNGRWAYSNLGWTWQSNYSWGWAPFHYGSWLYDDMYGWLWKPGYEWSPAWVTWGSAGNNYAWAPLMPDVNISMQFGNYRPHPYYWNVCGRDHIYDRYISNVIVHNTNVTNNITIINNYNKNTTNNYYAKGPDVNEVQRYSHNKIEPVTFRDVNQVKLAKQNGNVMQVYRPSIQNPENYRRVVVGNNAPAPINNNGINNVAQPQNNINRSQQQPAQYPQSTAVQKPDNSPVQQIPNRSVPQEAPNNNNNNRNPNTSQYQNIYPRVFKKVEAEQIKTIRNNSAMPINQPRQQMQNVRQLPIQRMERNNNNNRSEEKREIRRN